MQAEAITTLVTQERGLAGEILSWLVRGWGKLVKKAKVKNDAIMTGILVTKYKMGLIDVEDLGEVAKDMSGSERASAAEKVPSFSSMATRRRRPQR